MATPRIQAELTISGGRCHAFRLQRQRMSRTATFSPQLHAAAAPERAADARPVQTEGGPDGIRQAIVSIMFLHRALARDAQIHAGPARAAISRFVFYREDRDYNRFATILR
jgi:hypothetical protein